MKNSAYLVFFGVSFFLMTPFVGQAQELTAERVLPQPENTGRCRRAGGWGACQYKLYLTENQLAKALDFDRENNAKAKELGLGKEE